MNKLLFTISNYRVIGKRRRGGEGGGGEELKERSQRSERGYGAALLIQSRFEL
jgi:hypothetical protein